MIKIIGLRALAVGVIGSFLPMGLGFSKGLESCASGSGMVMAVSVLKLEPMQGFGIGASFATMCPGRLSIDIGFSGPPASR